MAVVGAQYEENAYERYGYRGYGEIARDLTEHALSEQQRNAHEDYAQHEQYHQYYENIKVAFFHLDLLISQSVGYVYEIVEVQPLGSRGGLDSGYIQYITHFVLVKRQGRGK